MGLGGGNFTSMDKVLPGSYINFVSASRANSNLSDRGVVALPFEFDWGPEDKVFTIKYDDFKENSLYLLGYNYNDDKLKGLREMFENINTCHFYRLNTGAKASNTLAEAKYTGARGNDLKIVIANSIDYDGKFEVSTLLDDKVVDTQIVETSSDLKENDFLVWKEIETLTPTVGMPLEGGRTDSNVTGESYQKCLDKLESYNFNVIGCLSTSDDIKNIFVSFVKRMRDTIGSKCQLVVHKKHNADYEGVISVENDALDENTKKSSLVYWVTGVSAGCLINKSNTNKTYDGEFDVDVNYNQLKLKEALNSGQFILHKVGDEVRVLEDINTFTSFKELKNEDFSSNQVVRVLDQIAIDTAVMFNNKYLGKIQNNSAGRISFWNDLVTHHKELLKLEAIEEFKEDDIKVLPGKDKKSVIVQDAVRAKLAECYITVFGRRYNFAQMINLEARMDKTKTKIPILGQTGSGNVSTGWEGTFNATMHYNQSVMREVLYQFKETGEDVYFDIQITNDDPNSSAGRQTIVLVGCNLDGGTLAKFDADGEYLDEDIEGTFEDWRMPEKFALINGM